MKRQIIYAEVLVRTNAHIKPGPRNKPEYNKINMVIKDVPVDRINSSKFVIGRAAKICKVKDRGKIKIVKVLKIINRLGYSNVEE